MIIAPELGEIFIWYRIDTGEAWLAYVARWNEGGNAGYHFDHISGPETRGYGPFDKEHGWIRMPWHELIRFNGPCACGQGISLPNDYLCRPCRQAKP